MREKQKIIFETFPKNLKKLREAKKWSQKELGKMIDADVQRISKYERGIVSPPIDTIIKFAELFEVSLDYLLIGEKFDINAFKDKEILRRLEQIKGLPEKDRKTLIAVIDTFIKKYNLESKEADRK